MSLPSYLLLSLNSTGSALGRDGGNIITTSKFSEMDKGCIRRNLFLQRNLWFYILPRASSYLILTMLKISRAGFITPILGRRKPRGVEVQ